MRRYVWTLTLLLPLVGCSKYSGKPDLQAHNPLDRARGVIIAAGDPDQTALHELVDRLLDRDPAVRMYAILALRRLTGEDLGYRYHASEVQRALAAERWRQAVDDGTVTISGGASEGPHVTPVPQVAEAGEGQVP